MSTADVRVDSPGTRYIHQLIERTVKDASGDRVTNKTVSKARNVIIAVRCGLEGPPYGMGDLDVRQGRVARHAPEDEIRSTAWPTDVTCPLCRRWPGVR